MGIVLGRKAEPFHIDLPQGVRVLVRPLRTSIQQAAVHEAASRIRQLTQGAEAVEDAGGEIDNLPDLSTASGRAGFGQEIYIMALATAAILEWEGVYSESGEPCEVTPESVAELMRHDGFADAFLTVYASEALSRISEGNALRPSPNGISAAEPHIVTDAANAMPPAQAGAKD
jgi:hypothetical protein